MRKSAAFELFQNEGPQACYDAVFPRWAGRLIDVPGHMWAGAVDWVVFGQMPGGFLQAVIRGDLYEAVAKADGINIHRITEWAGFFFHSAPSAAHGPNALRNWKGIEFDKEENVIELLRSKSS